MLLAKFLSVLSIVQAMYRDVQHNVGSEQNANFLQQIVGPGRIGPNHDRFREGNHQPALQ